MVASANLTRLVFGAALAAVTASAVLLAPASGSEAEKVKASVIGRTASTPAPNCPTPDVDNPPANETCQVVNRVTGFQINADGRSGPFKVREPGTIVAWSADLSRPSKTEQTFFAEEISNSGPPAARLSVLKPKGQGQFKLTKQSPVVALDPYLKERPVFTLTDPLRVKKGTVIALTTTSWIPDLAVKGAAATDAWRASRDPGQCGTEPNDTPSENETDLKERSRPHQKVGGTRAYACTYSGARMLYWAYFVPKGS
jgi:hypothetical protein